MATPPLAPNLSQHDRFSAHLKMVAKIDLRDSAGKPLAFWRIPEYKVSWRLPPEGKKGAYGIFADEAMTTQLVRVDVKENGWKVEQHVFDPTTDKKIGALRKDGFLSEFWVIFGADDRELARCKLKRSYLQFLVPIGLGRLLGPKIYEITISDPGQQMLGTATRGRNPFELARVELDLSADVDRRFDRRLAMILAAEMVTSVGS